MAANATAGTNTDTAQSSASGTSSKWIPLESNPDVMNSWAEKLGLATRLHKFTDIYGLDPELLALVPQPSKAVLLVFPITDEIDKARHKEDENIKNQGPQNHIDPTIIFIKQTIPNACGTIGLLHALGNADVTLKPLSSLSKFFEACAEKTPEERAHLLEHTDLFTSAHVEAATQGQTSIPADLDTNLHFVTFVPAPDPTSPVENSSRNEYAQHVIELDGRRNGPVDHGPVPVTGFLQGVASIVKKKYINNSVSLQFGMVSLGPPPTD